MGLGFPRWGVEPTTGGCVTTWLNPNVRGGGYGSPFLLGINSRGEWYSGVGG